MKYPNQLARQTGHSRNTIQKMLENEHSGYKNRSNQPFPVLEPYMRLIDSWLCSDKEQQSKQRHTARRIYHRLVKEHGFQGSEPTVRRYVRQAKAKPEHRWPRPSSLDFLMPVWKQRWTGVNLPQSLRVKAKGSSFFVCARSIPENALFGPIRSNSILICMLLPSLAAVFGF